MLRKRDCLECPIQAYDKHTPWTPGPTFSSDLVFKKSRLRKSTEWPAPVGTTSRDVVSTILGYSFLFSLHNHIQCHKTYVPLAKKCQKGHIPNVRSQLADRSPSFLAFFCGGGGGGGKGSSSQRLLSSPKIWSEKNRKISITIDLPPSLQKLPGRKPAFVWWHNRSG